MAVALALHALHDGVDLLAGDRRQDLQQIGHARLGLRVVAHFAFGIRHRTLELAGDHVGAVQQVDGVGLGLVGLGHFRGGLLQAHDPRTHLGNQRFGHLQGLAVEIVEAHRHIAGQLQVLLLVIAHRHLFGAVEQDVRRHQHRVVEQAGIDVVGVLAGLVLELGHAAELTHLGVAVQHPGQARVRGHVGLHEQHALDRVQPAGQVDAQEFVAARAQFFGRLAHGDGVHVHQRVVAVVLVLQGDPVLERAQVVAQGQLAGGLDA